MNASDVSAVETVRGPIGASDLGATLMHEHIFVRNPELEQNYPPSDPSDDSMLEDACRGLEELYRLGVSTLVDLTVLGLGRSIPHIARVAERVDINIVVATGYYLLERLPVFFQNRGPGRLIDADDPLESMFLDDINLGISGTSIKAGVIKVVVEHPEMSSDVERVLHAAAVAQLETGVPISTHTNARLATGRTQQAYFRKHGVSLERLVIGHSGDTTDLDYLRELMDNGSTIGMDRFGMEHVLSDNDRIATVVALCEQGYADRMVLSHDAAYYSVNSGPSYRKKNHPQWHHCHIHNDILPQLRERGVSEAMITTMMTANPARLLLRS